MRVSRIRTCKTVRKARTVRMSRMKTGKRVSEMRSDEKQAKEGHSEDW